jgi:hypothetical protein
MKVRLRIKANAQAGNNYRTGRKQLEDRQETIIGQAGNNHRTGRKQL